MTPKQASKIIGCSPTQVRHLIRKGTIRAQGYHSPTGGYYYEVTKREAERYRDTTPGGWPRGRPRLQKGPQ